ncbi:DUF3566 domain-containing protein [Aeromicrobium sp. Leaf350]|uniref:DUF3566 domain-containing protein n=1 Tax=Aeromicrobium sp. Leaf350 TaxID=2876565 RepID=UPI001E335A4D|nr:DUF3566 domain-containing protein [Aeromicrobium sp. Leaf350]
MSEDQEPGPVPRPPTTGNGASRDENPPADDPPADDVTPDRAVSKPAQKSPQKTAAKKAPARKPAAKKTATTSSSARNDQTSSTSTSTTPPSRPMTAADYARTVAGDPASTSVFPRVTDEPVEPKQEPVMPQSSPESSVTRQARLSLVHVDPWSVTQLAFVISTALMIVAVVAVTVFWVVLNVTGVWDNLNDTVNSVLSSEDGTFDVENYLGFGRVVGLTLVLSVINVVLMTALAAIGARLYNAATHLVGGVQVTFRDRG